MDKAVDALGGELARNSQIYMGYHGHVLTFPIDKGKTMNVVAFRTKLDGKWEDLMWVRPSTTEDMFADFVGWGDKVRNILGVSHTSAIFNYDIKAKGSVAHGKPRCMGVV